MAELSVEKSRCRRTPSLREPGGARDTGVMLADNNKRGFEPALMLVLEGNEWQTPRSQPCGLLDTRLHARKKVGHSSMQANGRKASSLQRIVKCF